MRIGTFDLETHGLVPTYGPILCASCWLEPENKMVTYRQDAYVRAGKAEDMIDDKALCVDIRDCLETRHITSGYFSKGFDISHLNSRLAYHGERLMEPRLHIDPIWSFKGWRGIKAQSGKMKHMAEFFGLEQKEEVTPENWMKARAGNKKAMDVVVARCESDVRITVALTEKALDLKLIKNVGVYP